MSNEFERRTVIIVAIVIVASLAVGVVINNPVQPVQSVSIHTTSTTFTSINSLSIYQDDVDLLPLSLQAPSWKFLLSNGSYLQLSKLRGRFVIIMLMATWCSACKLQGPTMENLHNSYSEDLVVLSLTVDVSETAGMMAEYQESNSYSYLHGLDSDSNLTNYFQVMYIPTTIIIDSDGYCRWKHVAVWDETDITHILETLME